ncbi:MAG: Lipoprotein-releasing system ATP-binding protein LolD [Candidatus Heimdallarchaeota archaeon AB_125]|nr:MAG: Lipoprotein-releasing system ATP-binding protein LolD [Candidatus Heimdallarchaeota archaeon AB_125]
MITCNDVIKIYSDHDTELKVAALRGLDFKVREGELVSIIGPSGAGKTTLIKILSGIEQPTSGDIIINGMDFNKLDEFERRDYRFNHLGIINQFTSENLFTHLSVRQNLLIPKRLFFLPKEQSRKETDGLLEILNLKHVEHNTVDKLSGGEAMRLSMGVALAKNPSVLLADEPTGQLDSMNTEGMIETIKQINQEMGKTILVVTHDIRYRNVFEKSFVIRDGKLAGIGKDIGKDELEFLLHASELNKAYMDASNYVRIPDEIKSLTGLGEIIEFDTHPSRKVGMFWNPEKITRDKVYEMISNPMEDIDDKIEQISYEEVEKLLSREFIPPEKAKPIVRIKNMSKGYQSRAGFTEIITNLNLNIDKGDFVFISGPSGVGKTTLLNLIAGLIKPNKGSIKVQNFSINDSNEKQVSLFRLNNIAYITQHNNLFSPLPIKDNFILPNIFSKKKNDKDYGLSIAKECFIDHKLDSYPGELSEGEKQRAALATSLTRRTSVILADEPTANLDTELARSIMDLLMDTVRINNATIITCSHDLTLLRPGFRHIRLLDGNILEDARVTKKDLKKIVTEYLQIKQNKGKRRSKKK